MTGAIGARVRDYIDSVTERWIGWTFPPAERAIEDAEWKSDDSAAYCRRCGDSVGPGEATSDGCGTCRAGAELSGGIGDGVIRLGPYVESLRDWILKIKYERWAEMGECLGRHLALRVREAGVIDLSRTIVVAMPMPWQRRIYRGIDHAAVIASSAACQLRAPVARILRRSNHVPQVALIPSQRRRGGSRGMRVRRRLGGWPIQNYHVLLIDDVRTTGATLKTAVRLVRSLKPQRIVCGVLAVSDSKSRRARAQKLLPATAVAAPAPQSV